MKELKHEQRKMARKARIKTLRGSRYNISHSDVKLDKGELLLDTDDGYIIAGLTNDTAVNNSSNIVATNRLIGYKSDSTSLSEDKSADDEYHVGYNSESGKFEIVSNGSSIYVKSDGDVKLNQNTSVSSDGNTLSVGHISIEGGSNRVVFGGSRSISIGYGSNASGGNSVALGTNANASGTSSTVVGEGANASERYSTALGYHARAFGCSSIALGYYAEASVNFSTALGYYAKASGVHSTALGYMTRISGEDSTALGSGANTSGSYSTAVGRYANASGESSTALGYYANASGDDSIAHGTNANASEEGSVAIGFNARSNASGSVQIGEGENNNAGTLQFRDKTIANESHLIGPFSGNISGESASFENISSNKSYTKTLSFTESVNIFSQGYGVAIGRNSSVGHKSPIYYEVGVSIGNNASSSDGVGALVIGNNASAKKGSDASLPSNDNCNNAIAIGDNARAVNWDTSALGYCASALRHGAIAIGNTSIADGVGAIAIGDNANASAEGAVQLGTGKNLTAKTLQFGDTKIADTDGNVYTGFSGEWNKLRLHNPSTFPTGNSSIRTTALSNGVYLIKRVDSSSNNHMASGIMVVDGEMASSFNMPSDRIGGGFGVQTVMFWKAGNYGYLEVAETYETNSYIMSNESLWDYSSRDSGYFWYKSIS